MKQTGTLLALLFLVPVAQFVAAAPVLQGGTLARDTIFTHFPHDTPALGILRVYLPAQKQPVEIAWIALKGAEKSKRWEF